MLIEMTAEVVGAYTFKANGKDVAKVTVLGNQGGPMGNGIECTPYGIFELDAEMAVFRALANIQAPSTIRFRADLKPINATGGYVIHILEILP